MSSEVVREYPATSGAGWVHKRHAGLLIPLFSMCSTRGWGIGEIPDVVPVARWLAEAGCDILQILPVNEMSADQNSPYSAVSAMAVDPIYLHLPAVSDFATLGGERSLSSEARQRLRRVRRSRRIQYQTVRELKHAALWSAFEQFLGAEWRQGTTRAEECAAFIAREHWWLEDYARFRALHGWHHNRPWWTWEEQFRDGARRAPLPRSLETEALYYKYVQWQADRQWQEMVRQSAPVALVGDLPFMVGGDSADVWTRQHAFHLDATIGAPPDAFSETGQDWGVPAYRWDVFASEGFEWLVQRARRAAALFSGFRVDHLVGFYRTYIRPSDQSAPYFSPAEEPQQLELGERVLDMFRRSGATLVAEDLGTIPPFVRESLQRLGIPGYKVLRWERQWDVDGQPFLDPATYPSSSVATTGTHDTDPLSIWWHLAPTAEREALLRIPALAGRGLDPRQPHLDGHIRDSLLETLFAAGSNLLVIPVQDVFGWEDRINTPATVTSDNWTYRLPWPVDRLMDEPEAQERLQTMQRWNDATRRGWRAHLS